jgi:lauroyl/myristoyl acyltransferase
MASHRLETTYQAGWFNLGNRVVVLFPRSWLRAGAAIWGKIFAWLHPAKVAVVEKNLELLQLPQKPNPVQVYAEFGRVMVDYFYAGAHSLDHAIQLVDERKGFAHLAAAQTEGKGALFISPHLSFFELGGVIMKDIGIPLVALTNPEPSPELTAWRASYRLRWGVETLEVGHDQMQFLNVLKELAAGKFVAALFDRPHASQSYNAQLPGGFLPCSSGVLLLALLAKCPVIPVTVVVKANGKYSLEALTPIRVERRGTSAETLQHYTQVVMDAILPTLQKYPEQWFQFATLHPQSDL